MLKECLFPCISFLNKMIPKSNRRVLLYIPNKRFVFSLGPLKQYLIENGYDMKYKISYGYQDFEKYGNSKWIEKLAIIRSYLLFLITRYVFYTAGQIPIKPSKKQMVVHVHHGNSSLKPLGKLANINNGDEFYFTYMIVPSEFYIPIRAKEYECPESCLKIAGEPMADAMLKAPRGVYDFNSFDKVLVWAPTFRRSEIMGYNDSNLDTLVPLFEVGDYPDLNSLLEKYNIKLIVKLHPIQTIQSGEQRIFSHLSVFSHDEFISNGYDLYTLIANSDGLIGDYSTVSMHYLLMDRPLAYVVPDIDDYAGNRGFSVDNPEDFMGGHIIKTKGEFLQFIEDFAKGKDVYRNKRHQVCDIVYKYKDSNACKRIIELSGMKL